MKKNDNESKRLIAFAATLAVILSAVLAAGIFWASIEIGGIKRSIAEANQKTEEISNIGRIDQDKFTKEVASLVRLPAPIEGKPGKNGTDGKDSLSTNTVIEKQTIIKEQLPPEKGEKGDSGEPAREIDFGISRNGHPIWKWSTDREWRLFQAVEVDL